MKKITLLSTLSMLFFFCSMTIGLACQRPANFVITGFTANTVSFKWDAVIAAENYQMEYRHVNSSTWVQLVFNTNEGTITGLNPSNTYYARLRSNCADIGLSPYTPTVQFVTPTGPQPCEMPLYLTLDEVTNTSARFSWTNIPGVVNYEMQYRQLGTADWMSKYVPTNGGTLIDLMPNVLYETRVRANCSEGAQSPWINNLWSNTISFGPLQGNTCMPPANMVVSNVTATGAIISFSKMSNSDEVQVQYRIKNSNGYKDAFTTMGSVTLVGLTPGQTYEVRARSRCLNNFSDYSEPVWFTTPAGPACGTPTNVFITDINANNANISWTAISGVSYYQLQYRPQGTAQWFSNNVENNSRIVTNLLAVTNYEVRVRAICSEGTSNYSGIFTFSTLQDGVGNCPIPTNLNLQSVGFSNASVNWLAVPAASRYNLRYRVVGTTTWTNRNTTQSSFTLTALEPGRTYEWQVRTQCGNVFSGYTTSRIFATSQASRLASSNNTLEATVYPNPTNGLSTVRFNGNGSNATISVSDLTGRTVIEKSISTTTGTNEVSLNLSDYSSGLYFVNVRTQNESRTFKLIVE